MPSNSPNINFIISYLTMRRLIGILAIALPIIVVGGGYLQYGHKIEGSISGYYYTNMRDFFVGLLSGVSLFLISYKGYEKIDDIIGNLSGLCALGMVLFPTGMFSNRILKVGIFLIDDNTSAIIHLIFASLFFVLLAFNAIFLFTKSATGIFTREKKRRNVIYRLCGIVMLLSMLCIIVYSTFWKYSYLSKLNPVFFFETIALISFGISWLIKGETMLKDKITD